MREHYSFRSKSKVDFAQWEFYLEEWPKHSICQLEIKKGGLFVDCRFRFHSSSVIAFEADPVFLWLGQHKAKSGSQINIKPLFCLIVCEGSD